MNKISATISLIVLLREKKAIITELFLIGEKLIEISSERNASEIKKKLENGE